MSLFRVASSDAKLAWAEREWCFIAEQPAPAPHLARPEGRAAITHLCQLLCSVSAALCMGRWACKHFSSSSLLSLQVLEGP